jgi:hypothetical protein
MHIAIQPNVIIYKVTLHLLAGQFLP